MTDPVEIARKLTKAACKQSGQAETRRTVIVGPDGHCLGLAVRAELEKM